MHVSDTAMVANISSGRVLLGVPSYATYAGSFGSLSMGIIPGAAAFYAMRRIG